MDPNACLETIARALETKAYSRAKEYREYLIEWIAKGGFQPDWSKHPRATKFVLGKVKS